MRLVFLIVFSVLLVGSTDGVAQSDMMAPPATLRGVVVWADGQTRVDKLRVRLWDSETEKVVYRARTDKNGIFNVPHVSNGNHFLTVGPVRISMRILKPRAGVVVQSHSIVVVIPKRLPLSPSLVSSAVLALPRVPSETLNVPPEPIVISP